MPNHVNRNIAGRYDTTYIRQEAIKTLERHLVFADFMTPGNIPNNAGSTLRFQIDNNPQKVGGAGGAGTGFEHALTANDDGGASNPNPGIGNTGNPPWNDGAAGIQWTNRSTFNQADWDGTNIEKQIHSYGGFVPVRNADLDDMPKNVMSRLGERLGYVGRLTLDNLCRATFDGTGQAAPYYPSMGSGTNQVRKSIGDGTNDNDLTVGDKLTAEDVALITGDMWDADVEPFSNGFYSLVCHSKAATHLVTDVTDSRLTWEKMNRYISGFSGQEKLTKGHLGAVVGTMLIRANTISVEDLPAGGDQSAAVKAYNNIITGRDGGGNVQRDDVAPVVYINRPNENSTDNPFRMFATAAFYFRCGPTLLDPLRVRRLQSATGETV